MRKVSLIALLIFIISGLSGQNYEISFEGSGAASTVDSVVVYDVNNNTTETVSGSDIFVIGIADVQLNEKPLEIYPNPVFSNATISFSVQQSGNAIVAVYDISGRLMHQTNQYLRSGVSSFNLSGLGGGIYTIAVKANGYQYSGKIVSRNFSNSSNINITYNGTETVEKVVPTKKNTKSVDYFSYEKGTLLHFKGYSGDYINVVPLMLTEDTTVTFNFTPASDADGNNYPTVEIGEQTWLAENLRTTTYTNTQSITMIDTNANWAADTLGAYCWWENDPDTLPEAYGALYNYYTVETGNLCPDGWHVPTNEEWDELENFIGNDSIAGLTLKTAKGWTEPGNGTDIYGFSAYPASERSGYFGYYGFIGDAAYFWSATTDTADTLNNSAYHRKLYYLSNGIETGTSDKNRGISVRCVQD